VRAARRAFRKKRLFLFLFIRGGGVLGRLRLGQALLEFIHAASGIHELLRARIKRMADVADADQERILRGTGFDYIATRATNFRFLIFGM